MDKSKTQNTAIIYFSLSPRKEAELKSFISEKSFYENYKIADLLKTHSKCQIDQSGLPYYAFDEQNQQGSTFGEKLTAAYAEVFEQGYHYVIAVGSDTPRLSTNHILEAANRLEAQTSDIVLGPATDGGTWLMGFSRHAFDADIMEQLPWKDRNLLGTLFTIFGQTLHLSLLDTLDDIDDEESLSKFIRYRFTEEALLTLQRNIRNLIKSELLQFENTKEYRVPQALIFNFLLRAPPATSDLLLLK